MRLANVNGPTRFEKPIACTETERRAFARLVRRGFEGSDDGLDDRIREAEWLAFHHTSGGALAAIAAVKAPVDRVREEVFRRAAVPDSIADYRLELGWVFVVPEHRGHRIAEDLCRSLLARVPSSAVFATTRPDNVPMIRILHSLGFVRSGRPFPHPRREEMLVLFLRSRQPREAPHSTT